MTPLYDEVFALAHRANGKQRLPRTTIGVGLVAAALAELRLHGRLAHGEHTGRVPVLDSRPTGLPVADRVLAAVAGRAPVHETLDELAHPVFAQVAATVAGPGADDARARVVRAVADPAAHPRDLELGKVLWAIELSGAVLTWAVPTRFYLGRVAANDWLPVAVREWMGGYLGTLPGQNATPGA